MHAWRGRKHSQPSIVSCACRSVMGADAEERRRAANGPMTARSNQSESMRMITRVSQTTESALVLRERAYMYACMHACAPVRKNIYIYACMARPQTLTLVFGRIVRVSECDGRRCRGETMSSERPNHGKKQSKRINANDNRVSQTTESSSALVCLLTTRVEAP